MKPDRLYNAERARRLAIPCDPAIQLHLPHPPCYRIILYILMGVSGLFGNFTAGFM